MSTSSLWSSPSAFEEELGAAGVPLHFNGVVRLPFVIRRLRPQILHCHMFHANIAGRLLRLIMPFRGVICTLHSVAESGRGSDRIRLRDALYRITDRLANITTAVSQAVADRHQQSRAVRQARVIPNGVDTTRFRPDPAARARLRNKLDLKDEFVWIAAGRLMWEEELSRFARSPHSRRPPDRRRRAR